MESLNNTKKKYTNLLYFIDAFTDSIMKLFDNLCGFDHIIFYQ